MKSADFEVHGKNQNRKNPRTCLSVGTNQSDYPVASCRQSVGLSSTDGDSYETRETSLPLLPCTSPYDTVPLLEGYPWTEEISEEEYRRVCSYPAEGIPDDPGYPGADGSSLVSISVNSPYARRIKKIANKWFPQTKSTRLFHQSVPHLSDDGNTHVQTDTAIVLRSNLPGKGKSDALLFRKGCTLDRPDDRKYDKYK